MIHWILNWVKAHSLLVIGVTVFSVVLLLFSVFMIPILVLNLPKDYFISDKKRVRPAFLHPSLFAVYAALKNILGVILVFLGLLMLVLPGQGIITLLIGLMIMDLPGERRALIFILRKTHAVKAMNWLREKNNKPRFELPGDTDSQHNISAGRSG
jgi:hypothetical protein